MREERPAPPATATSARPKPAELPAELVTAVRSASGHLTARARERLVEQLTGAVDAYNRGRFEEAARRIAGVAESAPEVAGVREVAGLANYRARRWRAAIAHLKAHAALTGQVEHLPVAMDCERALGHWRSVSTFFDEVRAASPSPDVLSEARIVMAAALADRGRLEEAVTLLVEAGAERNVRNPAERHVRQWYVLADLLERTGDVPRARALFARVATADPSAYDVDSRLAELGGRITSDRRRRSKRVRPQGPG